MSRKFCVLCGKADEELISSLCRSCYTRERVEIGLKEARGYLCSTCLAVLSSRWESFSGGLKEAVEEAAMNAAERGVFIEGLESPALSLEVENVEKTSPKDYLVELSLTASSEGLGIEEEKRAKVPVKLTLCTSCRRRESEYYEAIVQLRGFRDGEEARKEVRRSFEEELASLEEPSAFIARLEELKEGYNFYVGSAKAAKKCVLSLREKYGGEIKESASLYGKDSNGRELYRTTYLLRLPGLAPGDIVRHGEKLYQVMAISGDKVSLYAMVEGRRGSMSLKDAKEGELLAGGEDFREAIVTEALGREYQLLDLEQHKTFYIRSDKKLKVGSEVAVVSIEGSYYLLAREED